jgi:hypothetical protein
MSRATETVHGGMHCPDLAIVRRNERRLDRLIDRLPPRVQTTARWLRRPSSRLFRIPAGVLLVGGGFLGMLPLLGFWMLPLGLILLAEDVRPLRDARDRVLDWIERRRPHWFISDEVVSETSPPPNLTPPSLSSSHPPSIAPVTTRPLEPDRR